MAFNGRDAGEAAGVAFPLLLPGDAAGAGFLTIREEDGLAFARPNAGDVVSVSFSASGVGVVDGTGILEPDGDTAALTFERANVGELSSVLIPALERDGKEAGFSFTDRFPLEAGKPVAPADLAAAANDIDASAGWGGLAAERLTTAGKALIRGFTVPAAAATLAARVALEEADSDIDRWPAPGPPENRVARNCRDLPLPVDPPCCGRVPVLDI